MSALFITGTDTEVGKTVTTAALVVVARAAGLSPYVIKPAQTGVEPGEPGDLDEVRRLTGEVAGEEGVRLRAPLAPSTAARLESAALPSLGAQRDRVLARTTGHLALVEGAGGVLVPLGEHWNLLDLASAVAHAGTSVEFVVVARAGLGTLNHAALTVQAIQARGLVVGGIVIGSWPATPDLAAERNVEDLPLLTGVPLLGRIPSGAGAMDAGAFVAAAPSWVHLPA
jgi:dethiobiotin synthetase